MHSSTLKQPFISSSSPPFLMKRENFLKPSPLQIQENPGKRNTKKNPQISMPLNCVFRGPGKSRSRKPNPRNMAVFRLTIGEQPLLHTLSVSKKVPTISARVRSYTVLIVWLSLLNSYHIDSLAVKRYNILILTGTSFGFGVQIFI